MSAMLIKHKKKPRRLKAWKFKKQIIPVSRIALLV